MQPLSPLRKLKVRNTKAPHGPRTEIYPAPSQVQWRSRQEHPTFSCHGTRAHAKKTCTWWRSPSISSRSHPLTAKTWTRPNEAGLGVVGAVPDCHPIAHWIFAHDLVPQEESLREPNFHVLHSTSTKMPRKRLQIWQGWMQPQRVPRHFPRKTADRGRGTRWWRDAVSIGQSGPGLAEGGNLPVILSCKRGISISL